MGETETKFTVYVETTIVSYLTAWPSGDVIRAAQQKITHDWWHTQRHRFDLLTSQVVILEASSGDPVAAKARLEVLSELKVAASGAKAQQLADSLIIKSAMPRKAFRDAFHVAIAATNGIDFLLTWNCTHLANGTLWRKIQQTCVDAGFRPSTIVTPEQLAIEVTDD